MNHTLCRSVLALLVSLLTACSSFDAHWKEAASGKGQATRWAGEWRSGKNVYANGAYHHGRLHCVLVHQPDHSQVAYFHANWLIFSGNYDMTLQPVPAPPRRGNTQAYRGTHDLPAMFGGTYHYRATIAGDQFKADYTCRVDQGVFLLRRVPPDKENLDLHAQH